MVLLNTCVRCVIELYQQYFLGIINVFLVEFLEMNQKFKEKESSMIMIAEVSSSFFQFSNEIVVIDVSSFKETINYF